MNSASWRGATGSSRTHAVIGTPRPTRDPKTRKIVTSAPAKAAPVPVKPISRMSIGERLRLRAQLEQELRENERHKHRLKALLHKVLEADGE